MQQIENIREELKIISPKLVNANSNVFSVPANYFAELSRQILQKLKEGTEQAYYYPRQMPLTVPTQYFDGLSDQILKRVKKNKSYEVAKELEEIAPLLNSLDKEPLYSVPNNYFDQIRPSKIIPAKIIKPVFGKKIFRYMAAALVTGAIATGIFLVSEKENSSGSFNPTYSKTQVKNLSESEIINFLKTTSFAAETYSPAVNSSTSPDFNQSIKQMSDEEIQRFLEENGAGVNEEI